MEYTFDLVSVSPVLSFFNHQLGSHSQKTGAEYLGVYHCTLDAFLESVQTVPPTRGWDLDEVVDTVINFWLHNGHKVRHWKERLEDAGSENLLVGRVADLNALRFEFESLLE